MEIIMQLLKISVVPYKKKNYVKHKGHKERYYSEIVWEVCLTWEVPEYSDDMYRVI